MIILDFVIWTLKKACLVMVYFISIYGYFVFIFSITKNSSSLSRNEVRLS